MKVLLYNIQQMKKNLLSVIFFFLSILDQSIVSINQRSAQWNRFHNYFEFLFDIDNFSTVDSDTLIKNYHDLQIDENMKISDTESYDALPFFRNNLKRFFTTLQVLQNILRNSVGDVYANVVIANR
jgi:hypothetical protein